MRLVYFKTIKTEEFEMLHDGTFPEDEDMLKTWRWSLTRTISAQAKVCNFLNNESNVRFL